MKLQQKVFLFNTEDDLEGVDIKVLVNGKDDSLSPKYLFKQFESGDGKLSGYSILQFYKIKDGDLVDMEGNVITFSIKDKKLPIVKVRDPLAFIDSDIEVNLQYIKDVSSLLGLENIEKTIYGLSNSEKKIIVDDREQEYTAKELAKKEVEAKEVEAKEIEAKEIEAKAAEEAKKKEDDEKSELEKSNKVEEVKIPEGENILLEKEYKMLYRKYQRMSFKEYKKDNYLFFYGEDAPDSEHPFVLAKRDGYYERLDGSLIGDDENGVEYEFSDGKEDKVAILKDGVITIEEL